jgi:hypothetical protein
LCIAHKGEAVRDGACPFASRAFGTQRGVGVSLFRITPTSQISQTT